VSVFYGNRLSHRLRRGLNTLSHCFFTDANADWAKSIFVCGSGRSGTTWLAEILKKVRGRRYIYEPFNREQVPLCRTFGLRQYLRPGDNNPAFLIPASRIFRGQARGPWMDQYNQALIATTRLIKDVRSTLMLKWVHDHFPGMRIIYVVRHPGAVASSKVALGWRFEPAKAFFTQNELMLDYLEPFRNAVEASTSELEKHTVAWCIENYVPLRQLAPGDVFLCFYESLCANPKAELTKLFAYLTEPFDPSLLERVDQLSVTAQTRERPNGNRSLQDIASAWRRRLSRSEMQRISEITKIFGLDSLYVDERTADPETLIRIPRSMSAP
jgi:hypothetical protein